MESGQAVEVMKSKINRRAVLILALLGVSRAAVPKTAPFTTPAEPEPLKLLISVEQQTITAPFPARVTLHLHNGGSKPLWLYRHARDKAVIRRIEAVQTFGDEEAPRQANRSSGGASLEVHLEPDSSDPVARPGHGEILESAGLPHPRLVRLAPGDDYEERAVASLSAAMTSSGGATRPLWGRYRFSLVYASKYSNAEEINRILGVTIWQGEVTSNSIPLELVPPSGSSRGSITGTVVGADGHTISDLLVTLSDQQQRSVEQVWTDAQGRFAFSDLPPGLYWATARRDRSSVETAVFRHVELSAAEPASTVQLVMLPPEVYEAKQMLHKPALFRVTQGSGAAARGVVLEATWSSGTVLDNVKGESGEDGIVALELLPGRNFVSLKQRGCKKEDQLAEVAEGDGIDGFKFALDCR
jgi:hypothetical protein